MGIMDNYQQDGVSRIPKRMMDDIINVLLNGLYDGTPPKGKEKPARTRKLRKDSGIKRGPKKKTK